MRYLSFSEIIDNDQKKKRKMVSKSQVDKIGRTLAFPEEQSNIVMLAYK